MIVHVSTSTGRCVAVTVAPEATLADVIARLPGPPPAGARLAVAGRPLEASAAATTLAGRSAALHFALRGGMTIKVKTLTGREIEVDIEASDTVERIKERLEEQEGIAPDQQRLIFSGKQLNDDRPVSEYGIEGGSVLHLVIALRGGAVV